MWEYIPAVLGTVSSIVGSSSTASQNRNALAWNQYNANTQFNIDTANIQASALITQMNAKNVMAAAESNVKASDAAVGFNTEVIRETTKYNNLLLDEELTQMWDAMELDIQQLAAYRAQERGQIIADQAASGTVIGAGSNADVVVNQMTQEALDTFIVRHQADIEASKIQNIKSQNLWQGEMAIKQTEWDGQMSKYATLANAALQAGAMMTEGKISTMAGLTSSRLRYNAGMAGAAIDYNAVNQQRSNNLMNGLFSAAGSAAAAYGRNQVPQIQNPGSGLLT